MSDKLRSVIFAFQGRKRRHIRRYGEGRTDFVYKNIDDEVDIGKEPKLDVSEGMQETKKIGY